MVCCAFLVSVLNNASFGQAATGENSQAISRLATLAAAQFPNLTKAERAMLAYVDVANLDRGEFAICGPSADPADPSNDPKDAAKWTNDRDIRASLIRWLAVDRSAAERVDPKGLRVLGARVTGALDLSQVRVPFPMALDMCSFSETINLENADISGIFYLGGSYTAEIQAMDLNVHGILAFGAFEPGHVGAFHASGVVNLIGAKAEAFYFAGGHFHFSEKPSDSFGQDPAVKMALLLNVAQSKSDVTMCCGFESQGAVVVYGLITGNAGDLNCSGGRFINPNNFALVAGGANIEGSVDLAPMGMGFGGGGFYADGSVNFAGTHVGQGFRVQNARFTGTSTDQHGLIAPGLSVTSALIWQNVTMDKSAKLDLGGASIRYIQISKNSWPAPGNLLIDGLTYSALGQGPGEPLWDEHDYLRFLRLQPPGFHPQPYSQLAKSARENGGDSLAIRVLIASEDERYRQYGWAGALLGGFLKKTIGYGHRPLLTIGWMMGVVAIGWAMVAIGKRSGVMRLTWPETTPAPAGDPDADLHPLLYSFDVFLPFVNFHQEHYWWPDAKARGVCLIFGRAINVRGSVLRYYLWAQITAGWLLSAIFLAGVTGLIRND